MNDDLGTGTKPKHITEERYPKQTTIWKQLDDKGYNLHLKKNQDYSPSNILYTGLPGALVRLWDKICRLMNLFNIPFPNFQQILDSGQSHINDMIKLSTLKMKDDYGVEREVICVDSINCILQDEFFIMNDAARIDFTKFREREPANESIEDTISDLSNYVRILHLYYRRVWGR
jgi:hypothetical protein